MRCRTFLLHIGYIISRVQSRTLTRVHGAILCVYVDSVLSFGFLLWMSEWMKAFQFIIIIIILFYTIIFVEELCEPLLTRVNERLRAILSAVCAHIVYDCFVDDSYVWFFFLLICDFPSLSVWIRCAEIAAGRSVGRSVVSQLMFTIYCLHFCRCCLFVWMSFVYLFI